MPKFMIVLKKKEVILFSHVEYGSVKQSVSISVGRGWESYGENLKF